MQYMMNSMTSSMEEQMNPDTIKKVFVVIGSALAGIIAGKKYSDSKHEPIYECQREQAKKINDLYKKSR